MVRKINPYRLLWETLRGRGGPARTTVQIWAADLPEQLVDEMNVAPKRE